MHFILDFPKISSYVIHNLKLSENLIQPKCIGWEQIMFLYMCNWIYFWVKWHEWHWNLFPNNGTQNVCHFLRAICAIHLDPRSPPFHFINPRRSRWHTQRVGEALWREFSRHDAPLHSSAVPSWSALAGDSPQDHLCWRWHNVMKEVVCTTSIVGEVNDEEGNEKYDIADIRWIMVSLQVTYLSSCW